MSKESIDIPTIPLDAKVDITVSGFFHKRLVAAYFNLTKKFEPVKFKELCEHIGKDTINELKSEQDQTDAAMIHSLLALITELESQFNKAGLIKTESTDLPTED